MALDPKLVQYQAATMQNEAQTIVDQANALKPQVDATLAPAVQAVADAAQTTVGKAKALIAAANPPVEPPTKRGGALHLFPFQGGQNRPGTDPAVAWCNMPRGDGATFDPRPIPFGGSITLNKYTYGLTIAGNVGYTSTAQHDNVENHTVIVSDDRKTESDHYGYPAKALAPLSLRAGGDLFNNMGASGTTFMAGAVRYADIQKGSIDHAIALWVPWSVLDKNATHVWPARRVDNWHANYAGWVPMGALLAIPSNIPKPAGLSPTSSMIWDAFRNFGAVLRDTTGQYPGGLHIEAYCYDKGVSFNAGEIASKIMTQLRMVTNQSPDGTNNNPNRPVGGPGKRLAPYLDVV